MSVTEIFLSVCVINSFLVLIYNLVKILILIDIEKEKEEEILKDKEKNEIVASCWFSLIWFIIDILSIIILTELAFKIFLTLIVSLIAIKFKKIKNIEKFFEINQIIFDILIFIKPIFLTYCFKINKLS